MAYERENDPCRLLLNLSPKITKQAGGIQIFQTLVHLGLLQRLPFPLRNLTLKALDIDPGIRLDPHAKNRSSPGGHVAGEGGGRAQQKAGENQSRQQ